MNKTIYDLIAESHAARERLRKHLDRGPLEYADRQRLEEEAGRAAAIAYDRFRRLMLETNPAAMGADGPQMLDALRRAGR